ncbi:hypothetical protein J7T55_014338 [Diaporthe amygdali]|uniref:uncharacterized protein n=1 Tax=Phomopsis amygdali TaxID=1214568 RepID=UPI0022FF21A3|nr:uncharacterized protein J7T55_014338 [Diaporthe amygdali]KAJ0117888.1 hypothetical protein J7T55_014338 [Diaporthe amygdali]
MKRIRFQHLSKTFKDAVEVVRALGLSYIWIDSLCIIQDNDDDWKREAAKMSEVYREALCTICALSSSDGDGGCRVNGSNEEMTHLRYVDLDLGEYRIRLVEANYPGDMETLNWDAEYGDEDFTYQPLGKSPLRVRAWAFQERELSVRAIHFSRHTLLWECLEMKGSSEIPHSVSRHNYKSIPKPRQISPSDTGASGRDQWYGKVEDYTSRFLTYESDKFSAISRYAQHFRREMLSDGIYLAGLWKEHFPGCLLWMIKRETRVPGEKYPLPAIEPRRPTKYRAPTWSWASLDGEVTYRSQRVAYKSEIVVGTSPFSAYLLRYDVDLEESLFEVPTRASITMRGQITQVMLEHNLEAADDMSEYETELYRGLYDEAGDVIGVLYPDIMSEVQDLRHVWCLGFCDEVEARVDRPPEIVYLSRDHDWLPQKMMGIALCAASDECVFRRVGMVRWLDIFAFAGVGLSEVKIV